MTKRRKIGIALFIAYLLGIMYLVFLGSSYERLLGEAVRYNDMNLVPFKTISRYINAVGVVGIRASLKNILGNIIMFLPLIPIISLALEKRLSLVKALIIAFAFSFLIEIFQYYLRLGVFDVDDIILNVLGGVLGYFFQIRGEKL